MIFVVMAYIAVKFVYKYHSDRVITSLRELTAPTTRVMRDGRIREILTVKVVVGDILVLSECSRIPEDGRLIESFGLLDNEARLTGESALQEKRAGIDLSPETHIALSVLNNS